MVKTKGIKKLVARPSILAGLGSLLLCIQPLIAQSSALSYQGFLTDQGRPANAIYDLRFTLYDAATDGWVAADPVDIGDLTVTNGLFNVMLDFGGTAFDGNDRWLQIAVRPGESTGDFTNVVPRQKITATPYAIRAANFSGPVDASQITGTIASSHLGDGMITSDKFAAGAVVANLTAGNQGTLIFDGGGVTNLDAGNLGSGTIPAARFPAVLPAIDGSQLTGIGGGISPTNTPAASDIFEATSPTTYRSIPGSAKLNTTNGNVFGLTLNKVGSGSPLRFAPTDTNEASGNAAWTWQQSVADQSTNREIIYSQAFNYENGAVVDPTKHAWSEVWELNWDPFEPSDIRQLEHYRVFVDRTTGAQYRYQGEVLRDGDIEQNFYARLLWFAHPNRVNAPAISFTLLDADSGIAGHSEGELDVYGTIQVFGSTNSGGGRLLLGPRPDHVYSAYLSIANAQETKSLSLYGGGEGFGLDGQALIWAGQDILRIMAARQIVMTTNLAVLGNVSGSNFVGNAVQLAGTASAAGGFLIKSNSWLAIPTLEEGDVWLGSSNGILHSISLIEGTYTTNRLVP